MTFTKKRSNIILVLIIVVGLLLTACGNSNENPNTNTNSGSNGSSINKPSEPQEPSGSQEPNDSQEPSEPSLTTDQTTQTMVDSILAKVEQPALMDVTSEMVSDLYHLDPALLEQFTIKMPMMNIKTNEIAILQVKDANDIPVVEEALKQRAADVQKQFETYLQDQYENAKNYKLVVKDNYVLFVISEQADNLVNEFNSFFE